MPRQFGAYTFGSVTKRTFTFSRIWPPHRGLVSCDTGTECVRGKTRGQSMNTRVFVGDGVAAFTPDLWEKKKNVFFSMKIILTISTLTTSLHIDPVCVFGDSINMTEQRGLRHINSTESVAHITADLTILSRSLRTSDSKLHCLLPFIITKYTWKHHLFKNNGEPQGQTVIQTLWFLEWFCAQPSAEKHLAWMV